jgi:membrane protease YdiL (CAAX protease family)
MTAQTAHPGFAQKEVARTNWTHRLGLMIIFLICEAVIFLFGSNYFDIFPTNKNLTYNLIVSVLFMVAALLLKYTKRWSQYWLVAYAFFVASVAYPSTLILEVERILDRYALTPTTSQGLAIAKLIEVIVVVFPILVLVKLSGADFGSIYLKRGNLKLGMGIGLLVFSFLASASFMFAAQGFTSTETLAAAVVWGLVFSIVNGFMEELWLRGIFLKRFEPFLGISGSVWVTAIIFASMHSFVYYFMPSAIPFFFVNTLALGLACGYLMMRSDNIWGSTLIHAASDFFLFIAVLANA